MNAKRFAASHLVIVVLAVAFVHGSTKVLADESNQDAVPEVIKVLNDGKIPLTPSLIAWISHQSEGIVEEMESIAKYNAESTKFSVVSYLRYLALFNHLKVVASKPIDEFKWIARKAKTLARVYDSAMQIVLNYLHDVDRSLGMIEAKEPKSKQVDPSKDWSSNYETIRFIALHVSIINIVSVTYVRLVQ